MTSSPANEPSPTKLEYSTLNSGSGLSVETTEQGLIVRGLPVSPASAFVAAVFAVFMLGPMTMAVVSSILDPPSHLEVNEIVAGVFMGVVVLVFWPVMILLVWKSIRRRRVPTICTVNQSKLLLVTPQLPTLHHEISIDAALRVFAKSTGIKFTLRSIVRTGELHIQHEGKEVVLFHGHTLRELESVAYLLNTTLESRRA